MRDKEHSADLLNYMIYSGKQVIKPDDLQELNPNIVYDCISYNNSDTIYNRIKDVILKCTIMHDRTANYIIFSIENQTDINLTMPIRNMFSDALQYLNQLDEFKKIHKTKGDLEQKNFISGINENDKLLPVITVTVYWGADKWTAPKRLYEMLATSDKNVLKLTKNQTPEGGIDVCEALQEIIEDEKKVIREKYEKEISERDNALAEKDNTIAEKDAEIAMLKKKLEALGT